MVPIHKNAKNHKIHKNRKNPIKKKLKEKLKYPVMNAKYDFHLGFSFLIENPMNIDITSINVFRFL